jgi:hypothetical protein
MPIFPRARARFAERCIPATVQRELRRLRQCGVIRTQYRPITAVDLPPLPPQPVTFAGINDPVAAGDAVCSGNPSRTHGHTTDTPPAANEDPPRPEHRKAAGQGRVGECAARDSNPEPAD